MRSCARTDSSDPTAGSVFGYFTWTLLLSIPFYAWGLKWPVQSLPYGLPISATMIAVPALVATWRRQREQGTGAACALWLRVADLSCVTKYRWFGAALLTMPLAAGLAYLAMRELHLPLPSKVSVPLAKLPLLFVAYAVGAIPEEIGWTGYATEPLQKRLGIVRAGLIIGSVWAAWHVVPWWLGQRHSLGWVVGQFTATVFMRLVMGWLFARGGRSLGLAILFHAAINVCYSLFPNAGSHYNPCVLAAVLAVLFFAALAVGQVTARKGGTEREAL
jgi:membrane protease YdiL (CAAX protease family)